LSQVLIFFKPLGIDFGTHDVFLFLLSSFFLALSSSFNHHRKCGLVINQAQKRKDALDGVLTCQTWIDAESLLVFRLLPFTVAYLALFNPICA